MEHFNIALDPDAAGVVHKTKRVFDAGSFYETQNGRPPGKAPNGYRWSGVRIDEHDPRVKRWILISKLSEVPDMNQLPPVDRKGHEVKQFLVPFPQLREKSKH